MTDYKYPLHPYHEITDLKDMMEQSAKKYPDHVAFLTKPLKGEAYYPVSYQQFYADIEAVGSKFLELGFGPESRLAIVAETRYEWYVSYLAGMNGETVMVPIDKELQAEEMLSLFRRARCTGIIYSDTFAAQVESIAGRVPSLEHLILINDLAFAVGQTDTYTAESYSGPAEVCLENGEAVTVSLWNDLLREGRALVETGKSRFREVEIDPEIVRVLLFTSGTTDKSKCVMHSHKTICSNISEMGQLLFIGLNNDDVVLSVLPLNHTYECTCGFLYQIYKGNTIAQAEGLRYIAKNLQEAKATCILAVPLLLEAVHRSIWKNIQKQGKEKLVRHLMTLARFLHKLGLDVRRKIFKSIHAGLGGHMVTFISGGAAIDPQILQDLHDWGFVAVQGYGLTEFAPILALNREKYFRHDSAGLPLPSNELKIIEPDEDGVGEICGRGPNMMLGYYEAPELTAEHIVDGWYHTGDMGYVTEEGFLIITGRKKNTIITKNGKNIYPEELEAVLNRNPEIAESVVSAQATAGGDDIIIVEIFPSQEGLRERLGKEDPSEEEILAVLKDIVDKFNTQIPTYQGIRQIKLRTTEFPKNTARKILRDYSSKQ